jgi:hypothetical protein
MYHEKLDVFIEDLKLLHSIENISISDINSLNFKIQAFHLYLNTIFNGGKPEESLATHLFRPVMHDEDFCYLRAEPQIRAGRGWVDFLIHGAAGNPIAFELKPMHKLIVGALETCSLEKDFTDLSKETESKGENQLQTYLRKHEYTILTNMKDVFYFNKEARFKFEPFHREDFITFIEDLRREEFSIWDMIRRKEDATPKYDLDKRFFSDLKKWYEEFQDVQFKVGINADEKIVQILNKFIFLRTLEDYSLIPYNYIIDSYDIALNKWKTKGYKKVFKEFFSDLNEWAYLYYDTELFKDGIFSFIVQDENNITNLQKSVEKILGLSAWSRTFGMGLIHYNYRTINEDIFGKTYEIFLAEKREERGIHYTPSIITESMGKALIDELFLPISNELLKAIAEQRFNDTEKIANKFIAIKILDPACGSGSFLVKLLRLIWNVYKNIKRETEWSTQKTELLEPQDIADRRQWVLKIRQLLGFDSSRRLIPLIILRHLYGIDLDEKAIDVAKVNLWKEAIKLSPGDYRHSTLSSDIDHILPDLELNFVNANSLVDFSISDCIKHLKPFRTDIKKLLQLRQQYLENPFDPSGIDECKEIKKKIGEELYKNFETSYGNFEALPLFAPLNFFYCFFNEDGEPLVENEQGFSGVIGNPPYNVFVESEYFKQSEAAGTSNLFGHFIVKGVHLNKAWGAFSFIVPLSFACGSDYEKIRQLVYKNYGNLKTSHYSIRPARLFPEVDQRITIFLAKRKGETPCIVESSRLYRFTNEERDQIIAEPVTGIVGPMSDGYIPRIADSTGASIYKKFRGIDKKIADYQKEFKKGEAPCQDSVWWYHSVGRYWIKAYDFLPYFTRNGTPGISTKIKQVCALTKDIAKLCVSVVNSNLFHFWWIIQSDEFDVLLSEVLSMPMPEKLLTDKNILRLSDTLMKDFRKKALRKNINVKGVKIEMDEIHPRKSAKIIFDLDRILAPYYGLTEAELNFLQEYDKRFRLNNEEETTEVSE